MSTATIPQDESATATANTNPASAKGLIAAGCIVSLACLIAGVALLGRFMGNPGAMPSVWLLALLAIGFQVGFTLCACGLASLGQRAIGFYLPLILVCATVVAATTGIASYLSSSGVSDMKYLKPAKDAAWGWELQDEKGGLKRCSVIYAQTGSLAGQRTRSTLTITVPRQRRPPIGNDEWQQHRARIEREPKALGDIQRTKRDIEWIQINGQRALKVADTMSAGQGPGFVQARYYWYSPKLARMMTAVAMLQGASTWKLQSIEKMLRSIPIE